MHNGPIRNGSILLVRCQLSVYTCTHTNVHRGVAWLLTESVTCSFCFYGHSIAQLISGSVTFTASGSGRRGSNIVGSQTCCGGGTIAAPRLATTLGDGNAIPCIECGLDDVDAIVIGARSYLPGIHRRASAAHADTFFEIG